MQSAKQTGPQWLPLPSVGQAQPKHRFSGRVEAPAGTAEPLGLDGAGGSVLALVVSERREREPPALTPPLPEGGSGVSGAEPLTYGRRVAPVAT